MGKKIIVSGILFFFFIVASLLFWYQVQTILFSQPFFWLSMDQSSLFSLATVAFFLIPVLVIITLITVLEIEWYISAAIFTLAALIQFLVVPVSLLTFAGAVLFVFACMVFETSSRKALNNSVRYTFWHSLGIPLSHLISQIVIVLCLGLYQAGAANVQSFTFSVPDEYADRIIDLILQGTPELGGQEGQQEAPPTTEDSIDSLIDQQLELQGVDKDQLSGGQLDVLREQVENQIESLSQQTQDTVTNQSKNLVYEAIKTQMEQQINGLIDQFRPYIAIINAGLFYMVMSVFKSIVSLITLAGGFILLRLMVVSKVVAEVIETIQVKRIRWQSAEEGSNEEDL